VQGAVKEKELDKTMTDNAWKRKRKRYRFSIRMSALMMWRSDVGWGIIAFRMDTDIVECKQNRNIKRERKKE